MRHDTLRTQDAAIAWMRRFSRCHGKRHPSAIGAAEINAFVTHLAVNGHLSTSTQKQACSILLFLYQKMLHPHPVQIVGQVRPLWPTRQRVRLLLGGASTAAARVMDRLGCRVGSDDSGGDWIGSEEG